MFDNLIPSYNAAVENQRDGAIKFGSMMFLGTGGDFDGGGTKHAYEMFYNPEKYDIIKFNDMWEHKGDIGYFVPAYMGLNQFKDENGSTHVEEATQHLEQRRNKLRSQGGSTSALNSELQYRPLIPSEMFLAKTGNIFPIDELKQRLQVIEEEGYHSLLEKRVKLFFDPKQRYGVGYKIDTKNELTPINEFP